MKKDERKRLGWREWVGLPELGVDALRVKVDSGARTSALHAEDITIFRNKKTGQRSVRFTIYPRKDKKNKIKARAPLLEKRRVRSSLGHETERPVILTLLTVGDECWPVEITLINRDIMGYRMLLGRSALQANFLIDPAHSYLLSKGPKRRRKVKS